MKFQIVKGEKLLKMYNIFFVFTSLGTGEAIWDRSSLGGVFFEKRGAEVPSLSV